MYYPLHPTQEPRWYVVRSMHGSVLESRKLDDGIDLVREFAAAIVRCIDDGWRIGAFSSQSGVFFCDRGAERRQVSIDPTDPAKRRPMGSFRYPPAPGVKGHI